MAKCDAAHAEYDRLANGALQIGELPAWTRVRGRTAWYVARGPYAEMPGMWSTFQRKVGTARPGRPNGPPGDVYVCAPEDHAADGGAGILTILYLPIE